MQFNRHGKYGGCTGSYLRTFDDVQAQLSSRNVYFKSATSRARCSFQHSGQLIGQNGGFKKRPMVPVGHHAGMPWHITMPSHLDYEGLDFMYLFHRTLTLFLSFLLLFVSIGQAQAAIISNGDIIHQTQRAYDKEALMQAIRRVDVQQQLLRMGVSTAEIESRVNQMTRQEIAQLNQQINELPAGSGGIVGALLLIFIVFVITDVIGATDIFPFIHPVKH